MQYGGFGPRRSAATLGESRRWWPASWQTTRRTEIRPLALSAAAVCRERPRRRAAEQRDEFASFHLIQMHRCPSQGPHGSIPHWRGSSQGLAGLRRSTSAQAKKRPPPKLQRSASANCRHLAIWDPDGMAWRHSRTWRARYRLPGRRVRSFCCESWTREA
jgi:hypothetical protein